MGHIRLGTRSRTRRWNQVLDLIGGGKLEVLMPVVSNTTPGITGHLRFIVSAGNA